MPRAEHVKVIEAIADRFNSGSVDQLDELLAPGLQSFKRDLATMRAAFPDARFTIDDLIGEGDKLVDRFTITGTHEGPFAGIGPTGRKVALAGISVVRIDGARVVERWGISDQLGLLRQLGVLPANLARQ